MRSCFAWIIGLGLLASAWPVSAQQKSKETAKETSKDKTEAALPQEAYAKPKQPRKLLIYSKTLGFRHSSIPVGAAAITLLGKKTGAWSAVHTEDPAYFDEDRLNQFDGVLFLNTTGDCLAPRNGNLSDEEKATLEQRK